MESTTARLEMLQTDDGMNFFHVVLNVHASQALHVAHELNLFEIIGPDNALSLEEIGKILDLAARPSQALLSMCTSLKLLQLTTEGKFSLSQMAKKFLLKNSPFYLGKSLEINLMNAELFSFNSFKKALLENAPQIYAGKELFKTNEEQRRLAKYFTYSMHGKSMGLAGFWPNKIDLSRHHCFVDLGGGSGAHSIAAVLSFPSLQAIIFDRPAVLEVAQEYIQQNDLSDRIHTQVGDFWQDPFPKADLHFYSDTFHNWSLDQCKILAAKSYAALEPKGKILIHEILFNDDKTGPWAASLFNVIMLLWTAHGQQLSKKELVAILDEVGFVNIKIIPTGLGDWSLVEAQKL